MRDILRAIAPVLNGIPTVLAFQVIPMIFPTPAVRKLQQLGAFCRSGQCIPPRTDVGGLDSGKVLRVVGMAATMR